jgi:hypothetical protein
LKIALMCCRRSLFVGFFPCVNLKSSIKRLRVSPINSTVSLTFIVIHILRRLHFISIINMPTKKFFLFKKNNIKLLLYITSAVLTSLLADLQHYTQPSNQIISSLSDLSSLNILHVVINFSLHGIIAWRAFIDNSSNEDPKNSPCSESPCSEENTRTSP